MATLVKRHDYQSLYRTLVDHYEVCFDQYGPTAQGVDWPNEEEALLRHHVMQGLWRDDSTPKLSILDLGCGFGAFFDYLTANEPSYRIDYRGIDLSEKMIQYAETKFPTGHFSVRDVMLNPLEENSVDYVVMNGVFTEKLSLSQEEMMRFAQQMIQGAYKACRKGIAFNVMSCHVDTKRADLFHVAFDDLTQFLVKICDRHFIIRHDYGLYEYTVYLYKNPSRKTRR